MRLHYSSTSPFTRKVLVCAMELDMDGDIEKVPTNPWESAAELVDNNPLSRIPVLITDDGLVLYDSPVICEYLDSLNPELELFLRASQARWLALRLQTLADGTGDAAVLRRMETQGPANEQSAAWIERQVAVIQRALDELNEQAGQWYDQITIGQIATGRSSLAGSNSSPNVPPCRQRSRLPNGKAAVSKNICIAFGCKRKQGAQVDRCHFDS